MLKIISVFFVFILGLTCTAMAGALEDGDAAAKRGDVAAAVKFWTPLAERGDANLQEQLAEIYFLGLGVGKDQDEGLFWYRKAAALGNVNAQTQLGNFYSSGRALPKDPAMAVSWWRKAADQGDDDAMLSLGKALRTGAGVPQNDAEAARWFMKSAKGGAIEAQLEIGQALANGRGIPQDYVHAYMWMNIAAPSLRGNDDRKKLDDRKSLAAKMTPDQVKRAKAMADVCIDSSYRRCD